MSNNQKKDEKVEHFEFGEAKGWAAYTAIGAILAFILLIVVAIKMKDAKNMKAVLFLIALALGVATGVGIKVK